MNLDLCGILVFYDITLIQVFILLSFFLGFYILLFLGLVKFIDSQIRSIIVFS